MIATAQIQKRRRQFCIVTEYISKIQKYADFILLLMINMFMIAISLGYGLNSNSYETKKNTDGIA